MDRPGSPFSRDLSKEERGKEGHGKVSCWHILLRHMRAILTILKTDEQCAAYLLSLTVGEGGSVAVGPSGTECRGVCNSAYAMDDSVALTARPEDGYVFKEWGGGCSSCKTNLDCSIQMDADKICAATFDKASGNSGDNGGGGDSNGGGSGGGGGDSSGSGGGGGGGSSGGGGGGCSLQRR
jgi:hypothetical protein